MNELEEIDSPPEELIELTEKLTKDNFLLKHIIYQSGKAYFLYSTVDNKFVEVECSML